MTLSPAQIRFTRAIAFPGRDTVAAIIADLAEATGVSESDIRGTSQKREHVKLRQMAIWLARQEGLSQPVIAACFGIDHSTVHHAEKAIGAAMAVPVFRSVRGVM